MYIQHRKTKFLKMVINLKKSFVSRLRFNAFLYVAILALVLFKKNEGFQWGNTSKFLSFILLFMLIHYGATTLKILPIKIKIDR